VSNHPNRGKASRCRDPKPAEIRRAREAAGLTQEQAGELVCTGWRTWQNWEAETGTPEHRQMPAGAWRLFQYEIGLLAPPGRKRR
jgi:DNA-binding transcriptional regulator YiaG